MGPRHLIRIACTSTAVFNYNTRGEVINSVNNQHLSQNRAYNYDPVGNRLNSVEGDSTTTSTNPNTKIYATNTLNKYTQISTELSTPLTTVQSTYDDDGNMIADGSKKIYLWDCESRLIQVNSKIAVA